MPPVPGYLEQRISHRLSVGYPMTNTCTVLMVAAIVLGGIGWDIDRLTPDQVGWALKVRNTY